MAYHKDSCNTIQYIRKNINMIFLQNFDGIVKDLNLFFHYNLKILPTISDVSIALVAVELHYIIRHQINISY